MSRRERIAKLNERLVAAARGVRVLTRLSWPEQVVEEFLAAHARGAPALPDEVPPVDTNGLSEMAQELDRLVAECDRDEPVEAFLGATAQSYGTACRMLASATSPAFVEGSIELYGAPSDRPAGSSRTHAELASHLLANTEMLAAAGVTPESAFCLTAETVKRALERRLGDFFGEHAPAIVADPTLASKAAAGSRRIRIRGATCFSERDIVQLAEHEGMVHTGTAINGRLQTTLTALRLGAPRTTMTQEGVATLAELTSRSIDIERLRRLAIRTLAIQHALDGADFIEVFRLFLEAGQSEEESAHSAMRVFRGGDVRGGICFTKDVVYLAGLIEVHTFFRRAIADSRPELVGRTFAGRLTIADVIALGPAFDDGLIDAPRFVPAWAADIHGLAAYLVFSATIDRIDLDSVALEHLA